MTKSELALTLIKKCGISSRDLLLVGVSGGPDSVYLLQKLVELGQPVIAAHFDHGLRPDSANDALWVEKLAADLRVPFVTTREDVARLATQKKMSIEEAARTARYHFLFSAARQHQAAAVAVAHNADDQVETVLMHLLRGAGLNGLKGMAFRAVLPEWDDQIPLIRPLLDTWREAIEQYFSGTDFQPLRDPTNTETTFFRNRLRHEVLPYLAQINPQIRPTLWRMSQALAGDAQVLENLTSQAWQRCRLGQGDDWVRLDRAALLELETGLQRSILRQAAGLLRPALRDIDFDDIERAVEFIRHPSRSRQMDWFANLGFRLDQDTLVILRSGGHLPLDVPQLPGGACHDLAVPGEVILENGWMISASWADRISESTLDHAWLDADSLQMPLQVRPAQPGERFQPFGFENGTIKLSDFWINMRLPREQRAGWPLVVSGGRVVWVVGQRIAQPQRINEATRRIIHLHLVKHA